MARKTDLVGRSGALKMPPALVDGLLGYAVAMAVGVAVFTRSADSQPGPGTAYLFALGFGLILLIRRQHPVLVLILTSLGICVYYTLQFPAHRSRPADRCGAVLGRRRRSPSNQHGGVGGPGDADGVLPGERRARRWPTSRLRAATSYRLDRSVAGIGRWAWSRRLLKESQRVRERQARLELQRRATDQRTEERLRLARDLHDALGHNVAMISLQSAVAAEALPERVPEAQRAVAEIRNIGVATMAELRTTVRRLRSLDSAVELPAILEELPALTEHARSNGLDVQIVEAGGHREVPNPLGLAAYRIVQEALTNIIRHANATTAIVTLERGRDALTVTVRDDGQGQAEYAIGNGIRGMRERAAEWGGQLTVTSSGRDSGTVVTATLPWPQSAETRSDA